MYLQKYTFLIINFLAALLFCTNVNAQITVDGNTNDWASALNSQPLKAFVRDANDTNDDSFTQGSSDIGLISSWKWSNGQTNNKGDISNAAAVMIGNKIYFAGDRTAINGSAQIGFWFFKRGVAKGTEPDFVGVHEIGDLLVLSNFTNGGGVSELRIYRWVGSGGSDNQLDLIATTFDGFVNQTYQPTPVYPSWTYQGNNVPSVGVPPPNVYATGSFFEGSIDLSLFGLDPCFSSFLLETRNSPSVTAALQDFAGGKFNSMPDPPTVTNAERCGPGAITLSANCTTGNGVRWYSAASGGNPLTTADGVSANGTSLTVNITSNVTYYVACVRSGGQCESERVPVTGTIKSPPTVTLSGGPILCHGGTATLTATVNGGSGNYSYAWMKDNNPFNNPGGGNIIQNAGPGMYSVIITDTTQGCTSAQSNSVTLTDPAEIILSIDSGSILCHGGVATLTANASGGSGSYTYLWSNGETTQSIQAAAGSYSVSVTDANSCSKSASTTLTEPEQLAVNIGNTPILCHGGMSTLTANVSGGTGSYTYLWSNGETTASIQVGAGSYSVSVTDANSCSASASVTVSEPEQLAVNIGNTSISCHGGMSTLTANVSGGTGSYTYLWSNGETTASIQAGAGSYSVSVTDANSCNASASITVSEPEQLAVNIGNTPILCHGGMSTLTANASGGTGSYTYLWSNGATTPSIQAGAGSYSVSVTDANSCNASASITVSEPEQLAVNIGNTPILCHGGMSTLTANASGGTGSYTYLWSNGATTQSIQVGAGSYSVSVTDANSCSAPASITVSEPEQLAVNIGSTPIICYGGMSTLTANASGGTGSYSYLWSNGATTQSIQVSGGSYSVKVTDQNSCNAQASITVVAPSPLTLTINKGDVICLGGTATVSANVTGGMPPYSYLWSNGATTQTVNLPIGNFSVIVTDSNGCTISKDFEVKMLTCNGFTTVTQGGWGAKAAGNNWGKYRDNNFASAFPTGLTIGAGSRFLKLTTAKAVDDFLPSGTTPRALNAGTMVNPGSSYSNVLAGQVVALTLSLRFDQVNPSFSSSATWLGDLIVVSGTFAGWTVNQVLAEANNVLGGVASSYSADQMNAIVDAINNNYDGGTVNLGLLGCPCSSNVKPLAKDSTGNGEVMTKNPNASVNDDSKVYPNPTRGDINLSFENADGGNVSAYLFNSSGRMVADLSKNVSRHGNRVTISYQNYSLLEGIYILSVKASKFEKSYKIMIRK
ncbi:Ig-like domain-containing protein [Chryseobacterium gwangjuense]|uniref:Ig-like domain-containing protein n=1 Tax=Chryseobacterium gwangjuense TaxID=1069980 RepID=UPI001E43D42B|nr:T9SS type A sorting domain-containing protein [Chryseobacterium gwangjuense]MCE3076504.1 T9SS type A sorting domain-containing protein [Chryseobacterium gwangjuense]